MAMETPRRNRAVPRAWQPVHAVGLRQGHGALGHRAEMVLDLLDLGPA